MADVLNARFRRAIIVTEKLPILRDRPIDVAMIDCTGTSLVLGLVQNFKMNIIVDEE
jgi:hypothetical protein